jgi:hypothetical protein
MIANQTYTEVSSSGEGAHTILESEVPDWWTDVDSDWEHEDV